MWNNRDDEAADSAAFALGVLDEQEVGEYLGMLGSSPAQQGELRDYRRVVGLLGYAVPQVRPPASLKQTILSTARREATARSSHRLAVLRPLAAVLLLIFGLGGWIWGVTQQQQSQQLDQLVAQANALRAERTALSDLVRSEQLYTRDLNGDAPAPNARGQLVMAPDKAVGLLRLNNLPALDADHVYQIWLVRDGVRVSGGLFVVDAAGTAEVVVQAPDAITRYQAIGITVEPTGGSPGPTSPRVIGGQL